MDSLAEIMARVERLAVAREAARQAAPHIVRAASPSSEEHSLLPLAIPQAEMLLPPEYIQAEAFLEVSGYLALQNGSGDRSSLGGSASTWSFPLYLWPWQSARKMARKTGDIASMSLQSCRFLSRWDTSPGHKGVNGGA
jgi:hypothetical protein